MKENLLSPRQWAFVVVAGGAVCSLPFMQRSDQPGRESQSADSSALASYALDALVPPPVGSPSLNGDTLTSQVQSLPQWASVNRSPFEEMVVQKVAPPVATPPADQLQIQPLRPWISGPDDLPTASSVRPPASKPIARASTLASASASAELSPWRDDPASLGPYDQAVGWINGHGPEQLARSGLQSMADAAPKKSADAWPDQKVSEAQIAQRIESPRRELVSATIAPPRTSRTHTAAAQYEQRQLAQFNSSDTSSPPTTSPLATLPESRKQHVIFQPPRRK